MNDIRNDNDWELYFTWNLYTIENEILAPQILQS